MHPRRYIWFGSNVILFVFTYSLLPETCNRTFEEIYEMIEAELPARKFKSDVCPSTGITAGSRYGKDVEAEDGVSID